MILDGKRLGCHYINQSAPNTWFASNQPITTCGVVRLWRDRSQSVASTNLSQCPSVHLPLYRPSTTPSPSPKADSIIICLWPFFCLIVIIVVVFSFFTKSFLYLSRRFRQTVSIHLHRVSQSIINHACIHRLIAFAAAGIIGANLQHRDDP
jgi:hypothetical protein